MWPPAKVFTTQAAEEYNSVLSPFAGDELLVKTMLYSRRFAAFDFPRHSSMPQRALVVTRCRNLAQAALGWCDRNREAWTCLLVHSILETCALLNECSHNLRMLMLLGERQYCFRTPNLDAPW
jgi:hypothetical protein